MEGPDASRARWVGVVGVELHRSRDPIGGIEVWGQVGAQGGANIWYPIPDRLHLH